MSGLRLGRLPLISFMEDYKNKSPHLPAKSNAPKEESKNSFHPHSKAAEYSERREDKKISGHEEELRKIRDEVLNFKKSPLYGYRVKNKFYPVIGEGNHNAKIMFIGEAPGKNEAKTGRPFCGAAGKFLDELLKSIGIDRADVYITNIVKDRPPENRDPLPEEISIYGPFLDRQIELIRPEILVSLGRFSMKYLMEKFGLTEKLDLISRLHGRSFEAMAP
jgi:DNA polymerase